MERILVTGGSGFIGTHYIEACLEAGHEVLNIDFSEPKLSHRRELWRDLDILDAGELSEAVNEFNPTHVVHLAATVQMYGKDMEFYRTNTDGVRYLLDALAPLKQLKSAIFTSSKLVVPTGYVQSDLEDYCPDSFYGRSKMEGEQIVRQDTRLDCAKIIVRPASIWGPHSGYIPFMRSIARGLYVHPGSVDPPKSFGFVGNIVVQLDRLVHAAAEQVDGKVFYLSDYEEITIRKWAHAVADVAGRRRPVTVPAAAMKGMAKVGDLLYKLGWHHVPMQSIRLANMWSDTTNFDMGPTQDVVGPVPYTMEQGVKISVDWMREQRMF